MKILHHFGQNSGRLKILAQFFSFQVIIQFFNLLFGFLIIRWLSKEEYSKYSITFGFQNFVNALVDLGFSNAIIGMIGSNYTDKQAVGEYLQVARFYRQRLFWIIVPVSFLFFISLVSKYNWSFVDCIFLYTSIVIFLIAQGWSSYYSPLLLMHKSFASYYKPQVTSSISKIFLLLIAKFSAFLNSFTGVWLNTVSMVFNAIKFKKVASGFYSPTKIIEVNKKNEVRNYLLPIIPGIVFWAFQGQISLVLISIFGDTNNIAEVAALGRLGQVFVLLSAFSSVIIGPFLAKKSGTTFLRYFSILSLLAFLISFFLTVLAFLYPGPVLFLIGPNYYNLKKEVGFIMISGSVSYLAGFFYSVQTIKKWIFWWHSVLNIVITIIVQIVCIISFKLDSTLNVILLSMFSGAVSAFTNFFVCLFAINRRKF